MQCIRHELEEALGICHRCDLAYCRECLIMEVPDFLCAPCHQKALDLCAAEEDSLSSGGWGRRGGLLLLGSAMFIMILILLWVFR